ncbi:MAG: glycosyltransferase family 1 protein [Chloroflexota bacterium]
MHIGVDSRLIYHQPYGISKYTLNLLQAFAELNKTGRHNHIDESIPTGLSLDKPIEYLIFQHRRHVTPVISEPHFQRASLYSPVHTRLEQFTLPIELRFHDIDLLHSTDFIPPLRSPVPTVITVHDLAFLHWPHFLTKDSAAYYGQIDRAVSAAGHIIVPSESTRQDLIGQFGVPDSRVSVIYEAANPQYKPLPVEEARRDVVAQFKIPEKYILFVGTIEPRKNVEGLLRAYKYLREKYAVDDVGLVIRGSYGWLYEETLDVLDELNLRSSVFILGRVPDELLWKLYVGARCHVHAAHYEGFGLPPLEAMACGTPTIVSNVSSLPEVVGDAALLVDPNEWEEIAVAIHRLLSDDSLHAELRAKGLQRAGCFSWINAAQSTLQVYRHVLGQDDALPLPQHDKVNLGNTLSTSSQSTASERIPLK